MTKKYTKRPVIIEALEYLGEENISEVQDFVGEKLGYNPGMNEYYVETLGGNSYPLKKGDFIVKGRDGEFYLWGPSIFHLTYEQVNTELWGCSFCGCTEATEEFIDDRYKRCKNCGVDSLKWFI